jgi:RNA polymerase sigma factor (sigma-70 family)
MPQRDMLPAVLERLKASPADEDAWSFLYRQLWPFIIAIVYRRLKGREKKAAEDAAQEVFVRLLRAQPFGKIPNAEALRAYVAKIAENVARTHLRKVHVQEVGRRDVAEWHGLEPPLAGLESDDELRVRELWTLAESVLEPKDRDLLRLILEGSSLHQAADRMGLSYSNAGVRLHRIRRKLLIHLKSLEKKCSPFM